VGAGLWPSTRAIAERVPVGERVEPRRDSAWRREEHERWRQFVRLAAEL
jgi:glycerol kinase